MERCPMDNSQDDDAKDAQHVDDETLKRYGGVGWVDNPVPVKYDGPIEDFLNNGYMTFEEFLERVLKLIPPDDK